MADGPVIKYYRVPTGFMGLTNAAEYQSAAYRDILYDTQSMVPVERAVRPILDPAPNPGLGESDSNYKIELEKKGDGWYRPKAVQFDGKAWLFDHYGREPGVYIKYPAVYPHTTFEYTYVEKYDSLYRPNYTMDASGVRLTSTFQAANAHLFSGGEPINLYASFYYKEALAYSHPVGSETKGWFAPPSGDYVHFTSPIIERRNIGASNWTGAVSVPLSYFDMDEGILKWNSPPSGQEYRISGYRHTWERLTEHDLHHLRFTPGERYPSGIAAAPNLVRDLTENAPWYVYADFKVVNESPDVDLEKVLMRASLRAAKLNANGTIPNDPDASYLVDISRPWDRQEGQAEETNGYSGKFQGQMSVTTCAILLWEDSYVFASGIAPGLVDPITLQPIGDGIAYDSPYKFPTPLSGQDVPQIFDYYRSTDYVNSDIGYAHAPSKNVVLGVRGGRPSIRQPAGADEYMMLSRGRWTPSGFPRPGTVYGRLVWTFRKYDDNINNFDPDILETFHPVNESRGLKRFSLRAEGEYYSSE